VSDFRLKVIAETQAAESSLKQVDKVATEATRARNLKIEIPNYSDLSKNFRDLNKDIGSAANGIKDFYKVASKLPVGPINDINQLAGQLKRVAVTATDTSRNVGDAGDVIKATFNASNRAAETLVSRLTKIALGLYVIKEAAGLVQGAFGGMFNETIGREIKLRETILKAQTTLASTNKVFKDGKEITDPYQKIVTLTGAVRTNIDSIRERSIALAGVTSGEVIEVFGIVASQIGQIGGGLKEAEDLAITFAAALGTFGIPLYQARQEIGSILRGDITVDSYLATALGIRSQDIAKAKTEAGGVVKFLEERLGAAVAGQRIAAEGFSGVVSNIKDLSELVSQNFGAGLLDPLLDSLTKVFDFLFSIRNEMFAISKLAGESIGTVADTVLKMVGGATGGARQTEMRGEVGTFDPALGNAPALPMQRTVTSDFGADDALKAAKEAVTYVKVEFSKAFSTVYLQISTLLERVSSAFLAVGGGLAMLAKGLLSIKIETFKALIGAVESLSPALLVAAKGLGAFLGLWGKFMELPLVQELAQISAGMKVLEMTGVTPLIMTGGTLFVLFKNWSKVIEFVVTQFNSLRTIIGGVIAYIGGLIAQLASAATSMLTAWAPSLKALEGLRTELLGITKQLNDVAVSAQRAGASLSGAEQKVERLKGGIIGMIAGFIKFQLIMFAITAAVSIAMERLSAYKEAQDKIASDKRVQEAIRRLATTYKDLGENATEAQKRARAFEVSLVDQDYDKALANLEKVNKKLEELRDLSNERIGNWLQRTLQAMNLANMDVKPQKGESFSDAVYRTRLKERAAAELEVSKKAREVDKIAGQENVVLEAQKRVDLSKEYAELQRQQQNDLFQQRQTLAQKEVEIFRAAGELRIFQMEQANAKLIEGEEGASRAALEALNTYLSVRENGELEIEAAKKDIVIEVANLEKTIADYRFENEKKIAEIRKRAGENEKAMADARRQAEGQPPAGGSGGGGAATFGETGNVDNRDPNWVHGHFQTNTGTRDELISDVLPVLKELLSKGIPVELSSGARIAGGKDDSYYRQMLTRAAQQHGHSGDGRSLDLFVPKGTKVPVPLTDISGNKGRGGITGVLPGSGKSWLGHLAPGSKAGGAAGAPAAATPALQSLDVGAPSIAKYEEAVQGLAGAMERARRLSEALTNARTVAAFDAIAQAAFPRVALEGYQDSLAEAQLTYEAIAFSSADAFNPERTALATQATVQITRSVTELGQIQAEISKRENLSAAEKKKFIEQTTKAQADYVAGVREVERLQSAALGVKQAGDLLNALKAGTKATYDEIAAVTLRNKLQLEGLSPERVQAELNKVQIEKDTAAQLKNINELLRIQLDRRDALAAQIATAAPAAKAKLEKDLADALALIKTLQDQIAALPKATTERVNAEDAQAAALTPSTEPRDIVKNRINELKKEISELTNIGNIAVKVADGIGNAFAQAFQGLISGSMSAREALGSFFKSVADMFLEMAAQIIAKQMTMIILQTILKALGAIAGGTATSANPEAYAVGTGATIDFAANGASFANGIATFANGGAFTNSIVSSPSLFQFADGGVTRMGLMGEAGPEAIMPLKRGPGGRLGVDASGMTAPYQRSGAAPPEPEVPYQRGGPAPAVPYLKSAGNAPGGSMDTPIEVKFETVRIGGVDYVTRDEAEQIGRESAQRGADIAHKRYRNSPSARRAAGFS
jgi:hypothetical protein